MKSLGHRDADLAKAFMFAGLGFDLRLCGSAYRFGRVELEMQAYSDGLGQSPDCQGGELQC